MMKIYVLHFGYLSEVCSSYLNYIVTYHKKTRTNETESDITK